MNGSVTHMPMASRTKIDKEFDKVNTPPFNYKTEINTNISYFYHLSESLHFSSCFSFYFYPAKEMKKKVEEHLAQHNQTTF